MFSREEMISKVRNLGGWSVVATIRAPKGMVDKFLEHYLDLGASEIFLFFDDPNCCELSSKFLEEKKVKITICDEHFWSRCPSLYPLNTKGRPEGVEDRQRYNFILSLQMTKAQWMLHVDVDELLVSNIHIGYLLSSIPENVYSVLCKPLEAVYEETPYSIKEIYSTSFFKTRHKNITAAESIFGKDLLPSENGFWGHSIGKSFVRTDEICARVNNHKPWPLDKTLALSFMPNSFELLHYESMSFPLFKEKRLRRIKKTSWAKNISDVTEKRNLLLYEVYKKRGEEGLLTLFQKMNVLQKDVMDFAILEGMVVKKNFNASVSYLDRILVSVHGTILTYDSEKKKVLWSELRELKDSKQAIFLNCEMGRAGRGYLYCRFDKACKYFHTDYSGRLIVINKPKAEMLEVVKSSGKVSISTNRKFLTSSKQGDAIFSKDKASDWEWFKMELV